MLLGVVERRRRDKINSWIQQLSQLVPDCFAEERRQAEVFLALNLQQLIVGMIMYEGCLINKLLQHHSVSFPNIKNRNIRFVEI